ncbi:MAG: hypothetical protein ABW224_07910 [Kibdelosporangium sp.]
MSRGRKRIIVAIAAILTLVGGGIAFAYWTSSGTGAGTADTGESTAFTITAGTPVGTITPGGPGQAVGFTVTNPSTTAQYLTAVTATLAEPDGTAWVPPAGCLIADYTVTMTTAAPAGDIAAAGFVDGLVTVTLTNTGVNQDACQGEAVPLYFAAT